MGVLISRFRKQKSTTELLENLVKDIEELELQKQNSLQKQKRIIGHLLIYSLIIYIVSAILVYYNYFLDHWQNKVLYSIPLLVFPILIWLVRKLLLWYFVRQLKKNDTELTRLKEKKKAILDEVMEKETYRKAKEILDKFDPSRSKQIEDASKPVVNVQVADGQVLRQRGVQLPPGMTPPATPAKTPFRTPARTVLNGQQSSMQEVQYIQKTPALVRPILPADRTVLDRLVEALVGDGPQNRYALICQHCQRHNGMALPEEFEYIAFNCCYCSTFNAARKIRPLAPKLTVDNQTQEVKSKAESNFGVQENVGVTNDTQLENANVQNNASFKNGDDNTANNDGTVNENTPNEREDCIDVSPDMLAVNNDAAAASSNCEITTKIITITRKTSESISHEISDQKAKEE